MDKMEVMTGTQPFADDRILMVVWLGVIGRVLWLAVDGAYAKQPILQPVVVAGVVFFGLLRGC
jgi:hypothetical protein